MKRKISLLVTLLLLVLIIIGCGEKEELETTPSVSLDEMIEAEGEEELDECPEGYVYDYQVSMEPIPEEIAELGGDVCGTIHAYPTEIEAAILEKDMDVESQEKNERNIKGIKRYLDENYGGEFEIVPIQKEVWLYKCKELDTEKEFTIKIRPSYSEGVNDDAVAVCTYDYEDGVEDYKVEIENIIENVVSYESIYRIRRQTVNEIDSLDLYIAIFSEKQPDYLDEQKKIIEIFDVMKKFQKEEPIGLHLNLIITYFPIEYAEVITQQYQSKCFADIQQINTNSLPTLCANGEVYAQFRYMGTTDAEDRCSLDRLVEDKEDYFTNEYILPYWKGM